MLAPKELSSPIPSGLYTWPQADSRALTKPRIPISMARVTMKEGTWSRETIKPTTMPDTSPMSSATRIMAGRPYWLPTQAPTVAETAATAPTDRSHPPMATANMTPRPPMITGMDWVQMDFRLNGEKILPWDVMPNAMTRTTRAIRGSKSNS